MTRHRVVGLQLEGTERLRSAYHRRTELPRPARHDQHVGTDLGHTNAFVDGSLVAEHLL